MRVLAITNMYPTPNTPTSGTFVERQIHGLRQVGMEVEVLFVDRAGKGVGAYRRIGKVVGWRIAEFRPDIVHVLYGGVMAEIVTRAVADKPVVVSFCGTDLLGGYFLNFVRRMTVSYGVLASYLAARRADGIVVKSKNLRDALPRGINLGRVWVIPNGIDLNRFKPLDTVECRSKLGWSPEVFHVLFPSYAHHPRKRIELAWAAVAKLKSTGMRVELHQLKGVPHRQVPVWLNASDALVFTSIHEGSPNIVKEALACNRPVVSVDVGDVHERIEGVEGCYLALPNPNDLAAKLRLVLNHPRRVEGRVKVKQLSLERVAKRLREVYLSVLDPVGAS